MLVNFFTNKSNERNYLSIVGNVAQILSEFLVIIIKFYKFKYFRSIKRKKPIIY